MVVKWADAPRNQTPWTGHQAPQGMTPEQERQYWADRQHRQTAQHVRATTGKLPDWYKPAK